MVRDRLSEDAWEQIAGAFPPPAAVGRKRKDPRNMVDSILYVLRTGCPWRDLPEEFGPWQSVYHWFNAWASDGTLDQDLWCVDGTHVRAARCGAGGGKKGSRKSQLSMR